MATFAVFIHTLVFKNILTNKQGAMLYQAGYPYATRNTALILRTHTRAHVLGAYCGCGCGCGGGDGGCCRFTFYFYWTVSSTLIWNNLDLTLAAGNQTVLFVRFYIQVMILPRQARDKHGENSKRSDVFLQALALCSTSSPCGLSTPIRLRLWSSCFSGATAISPPGEAMTQEPAVTVMISLTCGIRSAFWGARRSGSGKQHAWQQPCGNLRFSSCCREPYASMPCVAFVLPSRCLCCFFFPRAERRTDGVLLGTQRVERARGVCGSVLCGAAPAEACAKAQPVLPARRAAQEGKAARRG